MHLYLYTSPPFNPLLLGYEPLWQINACRLRYQLASWAGEILTPRLARLICKLWKFIQGVHESFIMSELVAILGLTCPHGN